MSVIQDVGIIVRDVAKGLMSVIATSQRRPSEYLLLHYCERCNKYHAAPVARDGFPSTPRPQDKPEYWQGQMHYCKKCCKYHKVP